MDGGGNNNSHFSSRDFLHLERASARAVGFDTASGVTSCFKSASNAYLKHKMYDPHRRDKNQGNTPSWHKVVVIHNLDESLEFGSLGHLFWTHRLGYFQWRPIDANNNTMSIFACICTLIMSSDYHRLFPCISSLEEDDNFARFEAEKARKS